ncbi:MAG: conjugal transfer protein TraF [Rickettsiaceae bacterium]|nr:conjugal transfer protein TraF [Rickettsiaceae bacterium]
MKLINIKTLILVLLMGISLAATALNLTKWTNAIEQSTRGKSIYEADQKFKDEVELVFVYSSTCDYCKRFAPVFGEFINRSSISYKALTADGGFLPGFEDALYSPEALSKLQISAYPTVFAINQKTGVVVLFSQGYINLHDLYENYTAVKKYLYAGDIS